MTIPSERERSIVAAENLLYRIAMSRSRWAAEARRVLRHFPTKVEAKWIREEQERQMQEQGKGER